MMHIDFVGANLTLGKPPSMTDEQCSPLRVLKQVHKDEEGKVVETRFISAWMPNLEDKKAIAEGRPIWLIITSNFHPPVALVTEDENGESNEG